MTFFGAKIKVRMSNLPLPHIFPPSFAGEPPIFSETEVEKNPQCDGSSAQ